MTEDRETADEPLLMEQAALPAAGIFLDRHQVFVNTGEPIPIDGDRVTALCGTSLLIGPPPTEVLPGIPAMRFADCADCTAVLWAPPKEVGGEEALRIFLRLPGTMPVHIVEIGAATPAPMPLVSLCGAVFGVGQPVDRVDAGDGTPCTLCLLRSLSDRAHIEVAGERTAVG
ncbi:hypothetical protein [Actinoalloteichus hymeniacidonis]|uniref:Uncharacterized protein n=1 Tax=Actinoalloteichus hymeniacidonis TaxID=340345 RepID=A0AAC9HL00_9PSEU|nr:hypothetical protein [Actinoalloteichus hymeniacidonis]AOS61038.1 hypothetical protein TL08_00970 [Actinoalloteichus hymeniacidonis]MBB5910962.1 hypothetical protein [Actinoalloteichus hymeniacidonis]